MNFATLYLTRKTAGKIANKLPFNTQLSSVVTHIKINQKIINMI